MQMTNGSSQDSDSPRVVDDASEAAVEADRRWITIPIPLPPVGGSESFVLEGVSLLLCNAGGTPYVVKDECPHAQTSLKGGSIRGTIIECPLHGGQMDLRDGSPVAMPIRRPGTCYGVRRDGGSWQVGLPSRSAGNETG